MPAMTKSTRRALRTLVQVFTAAVIVVPLLPEEWQVPAVVLGAAFLAKAHNALETAGMIPAWLQDPRPSSDPCDES
jgi:uncharacterized membrane protein (DUF4010 family)